MIPSLRAFPSSRRLVAAACLGAVVGVGVAGYASGGTLPGSGRARRVIGYSVEHRPIVAILVAPHAGASRPMLVVGSIAGDEPGGVAVARLLGSQGAIAGVRLWLVPDMNPDGAVRGTRENARGVDLNRNFPFRWRPLGKPGSRYYSGPRPASEPESRAVASFISHLRPGLTVWLHQPYGLIDDSEGPRHAEQVLANATGLPLERLPDYPGSAIGWEDHLVPASAFDVELPGAPMTGAIVRRDAAAIRVLAEQYARR